MDVTSVRPPDEPRAPRMTVDPTYFNDLAYYDAPPYLLDGYLVPPTSGGPLSCSPASGPAIGRVAQQLRDTARLRDGNVILRYVANLSAEPYLNPGGPPGYSQDWLTAMTQLAVTGSNAFAAWSADETTDLTAYLTGLGLSVPDAVTVNNKIMSDFNATLAAIRNPGAGMIEGNLRADLKYKWIAVSGEDDPPDYPVNVKIASYPQFHEQITVDGHELSVRYILASSQLSGVVLQEPAIPADDEVVLYIHGEGSRAEEALDLIPEIFSVGAAAGRSFTVIALDLPGFGYTTRIANGVHETIPHEEIADMPPTSGVPGFVDTSPFTGSPLLDFVEHTITTFVETLIVPFGNAVTAVVGGSLGGHMALRFAASGKDWARNVVAWSPASVWERDVSLLGIYSFPHRVIANPVLAGRATEGVTVSAEGTRTETPDWRKTFFDTAWCQPTADIAGQFGPSVAAVALALITAGVITSFLGILLASAIVVALLALTPVPPQPSMWYRDDWPSDPPALYGVAKTTAIQEDLDDRFEVYNLNFRQWHWRISEEMVGYTFDALVPFINKPLLLMVGENDDYPQVHFFSNVTAFASTMTGPGHALTIQDTGHSIHNERPHFLAEQIIGFAPAPPENPDSELLWLFAEIMPSLF
jgi:pimeloyl-ACP methyl ester carboxylesterase